MKECEIDSLSIKDLENILKIEKEVEYSPWSREAFLFELNHNENARYLALRCGGQLVGYAGVWIFKKEAHVTTLSVAREKRGMGLGTILLWHLLDRSRKEGCQWITLEVSEENTPAISLYKKFGFICTGFRKNYYDRGQDALVMWAGSLQNKYFQEKMEEIKAGLPA
ncbi:MAG: ribosomal protein S18-alanine N-acetyltransferase [Candidatus Eremiobacteraeota bacterium]|nr:ribosomal protein S18-alanine N-acetyltransferase [Candidatus Eremiobacteraeota bacterium]